MSLDSTKLLAAIPAGLRDPLVASYKEIASNFAEHRWGPSELDGGKLCECVYWIIDGTLKGAYVAAPSKPNNMRTACYTIESGPASSHPAAQSLRILLPRMLPPLYEIRNNRGVGHVGGDVDPNQMDATVVYAMASFIMAELVRLFHNVTTKEAQDAVEALVERKLPLIWDSGSVTLTVRNGKRSLLKMLVDKLERLDKLNRDFGKADVGPLEALATVDDVLVSPVLRRVFCNPTNFSFNPRSTILARINRAELGDFDALVLGLFLMAHFKGQIVVPDLGFYGREAHMGLIREKRLIAGVHHLGELPPKLRQAALLIEDKRGSGTTYEDAEVLAKYARLEPLTNGYKEFVKDMVS